MEARNIGTSFKIIKLPDEQMAYKNAVFVSSVYQQDPNPVLVRIKAKHSTHELVYPLYYDPAIPEASVALPESMIDDLAYNIGDNLQLTMIDKSKCATQLVSQMDFTVRHSDQLTPLQLTKSHLIKNIIPSLFDYPVSAGQDLLFKIDHGSVIISINSLKTDDGISSDAVHTIYRIDALSRIEISFSPFLEAGIGFLPKNIQADDLGLLEKKAQSFKLNLKEVGGYKNEISRIIRGFTSRLMPPAFVSQYGMKHTKGMLIYGPSGTGKTLIARSLAKNLGVANVTVVNGPELKNRYVGQSTENLRNVFSQAQLDWQLYGDESDLHVIIFDEIDGLVPKRGAHQSAGVDDELVTQLLTLLDGLESPGNVYVIGITNRRDLIDPALLRPGRLEVQLAINLPDESSRHDILLIKTAEMRQANLLGDDVDLHYLANISRNFTGAELEFLVNAARQHAVLTNFDTQDNGEKIIFKQAIKNQGQLAKVMACHFDLAFKEVKPAFGLDYAGLHGDEVFVVFNRNLQIIVDHFAASLKSLISNSRMHRINVLISGESGVGKSALAAYLAKHSNASYIKTLSSSDLLGVSQERQLAIFDDIIDASKQVDLSVVLLDDLENILMADAANISYSNSIRLKLLQLLGLQHDAAHKSIIIATTSSSDFILRLKLHERFNQLLSLELLDVFDCIAGPKALLGTLCEKLGLHLKDSLKLERPEAPAFVTWRDLLFSLNQSLHADGSVSVQQVYNYLMQKSQAQPRQSYQVDRVINLTS